MATISDAAAARTTGTPKVVSDYLSSMGDWRFEAAKPCDHPAVRALARSLEASNGIAGLELVDPEIPGYQERTVRLLRRDGFAMVKNAFVEQLPALQAASDAAATAIMAADPAGLGNRGPGRYSFGVASTTGSCMHLPAWASLVDLPRISPVLAALWGERGYKCDGGGGDFSAPFCTEYQPLHTDYRDALWLPVRAGGPPLPMPAKIASDGGGSSGGHKLAGTFYDRSERVSVRDLPVPEVALNFLVQDFIKLNGPTRQIAGTQSSRQPIPTRDEEPLWMQRATILAPAGSVLIRVSVCCRVALLSATLIRT